MLAIRVVANLLLLLVADAQGRGGVCKVKVQGDREEYAWENK